MTNIIYISKRCPHCKKLLIMIYKNPALKDMFRIVAIETNPPPPFIKSVPSLYNTNNKLKIIQIATSNKMLRFRLEKGIMFLYFYRECYFSLLDLYSANGYLIPRTG